MSPEPRIGKRNVFIHLQLQRTHTFRHLVLDDEIGPDGTFTILSSAAAQLHQSGHSCILQQFISSNVGKRNLFCR